MAAEPISSSGGRFRCWLVPPRERGLLAVSPILGHFPDAFLGFNRPRRLPDFAFKSFGLSPTAKEQVGDRGALPPGAASDVFGIASAGARVGAAHGQRRSLDRVYPAMVAPKAQSGIGRPHAVASLSGTRALRLAHLVFFCGPTRTPQGTRR